MGDLLHSVTSPHHQRLKIRGEWSRPNLPSADFLTPEWLLFHVTRAAIWWRGLFVAPVSVASPTPATLRELDAFQWIK
jgi:hypothetical protein